MKKESNIKTKNQQDVEDKNIENSSKDVLSNHKKTKDNDKQMKLKDSKANSEPTLKDKEKSNEKTKKAKALVAKKQKSEKEARLEAIEKYKNVPIGQLYSNLDEMRAYVDILNQRRDELIKAKSHTNPKIRKEAIQKTLDNTFMLQFKFQDAVFRNHYVPSNITPASQQISNTENQDYGPRVMQRSQERVISNEPTPSFDVTRINIFNQTQQSNDMGSYRTHSGMENREARTIVAPVGIMVPPSPTMVPTPETVRTASSMGMENRQVPLPPTAQPIPNAQAFTPVPPPPPQQAPVAPVPPPNLQQTQQIVQQTTTVQQSLNGIQPIRVIEKAVVPKNALNIDIWPLYDKIDQVIHVRKQPKILVIFLVIFLVLLVLATIFFILWGFAVDWKHWTDWPLIDAFKFLFYPMPIPH